MSEQKLVHVYKSFAVENDGILRGSLQSWSSRHMSATCGAAGVPEWARASNRDRCLRHLREQTCACGNYGTFEIEETPGWRLRSHTDADVAFARCVAFGHVWFWTKGIRAADLRIEELWIRGNVSDDVLDALRARYEVPVTLLWPSLKPRSPNAGKRRSFVALRLGARPYRMLEFLAFAGPQRWSMLKERFNFSGADSILTRMGGFGGGQLLAYPLPLIMRVERGLYDLTDYGRAVLEQRGKLIPKDEFERRSQKYKIITIPRIAPFIVQQLINHSCTCSCGRKLGHRGKMKYGCKQL